MSIDNRNTDFCFVFVGDYQRSVTHFYSIGVFMDGEHFAYGYHTPDGVFHQGITIWDGETFSNS